MGGVGLVYCMEGLWGSRLPSINACRHALTWFWITEGAKDSTTEGEDEDKK